VCDEQARGVRADVDDRDALHQMVGSAAAVRGQASADVVGPAIYPAGWGSGWPARPASRLSTATAVMRSRAARVAEPMCGTTSTCEAFRIGSPGAGGSGSVTSRAAV